MQDPLLLIAVALFSLLGLGITILAALKGWRGWLDLKRAEISSQRPEPVYPSAARIEVADLKERIRRLEAIASGIE
ncbi:MAG: hypothetical protein H0W74_02105 [Sphingosinicella sp.]|nr:hypothetical protein [Sphingosinicella sp.]